MKAVRVHQFGGPEVMKIEEIPDPVCSPGQVLVRIHAAGVNPVETYMRSGSYEIKPKLPYTPGSDGAGVVESAGEGVRRFKTGDRVYIAGSLTGTYAEKALSAESQVHPLPEKVSLAQGAAIGIPYATAYRALFQRGQAVPGQTVLVHGAPGGVGIAAVQLCSAVGIKVIGTAGSHNGRRIASENGAMQVFDHKDPRRFEEILRSTGGRGVDVIVELLANVNLGKDLGILAKRGRVVVIGSRGTVDIDPRDAMGRDADIRGMVLFNASDGELHSIHAALGAGLKNGTLVPHIGSEIPLSEAPRAHHQIMEKSATGKIVLLV